MKRTYIALLAAALLLQASPVVQLLPANEFAARDGRPGPGKKWKLSDQDGTELAAELTRTHQLTAMAIDYEHQTFRSEANGLPAPAAAWATKFEWRAGQGLFATDVKWTDAARLAIEADEYRYISPVIVWAPDGRVIGLINAAITNTPALLGMESVSAPVAAHQQLAAMLAAQFATTKDDDMNTLQLLIAQLGLKADTSESEALAAVAAMKATVAGQPTIPQPLAAALSLKADGEISTAVTAIETLKAKANSAEATSLSTISALNAQLTVLTARLAGDEVEQLVSQALKDGKLVPATEAWARNLGKANLEQLKTFIAAAPALQLGTTQTGGDDPTKTGGDKKLTAEEQTVCTQLGLDPAEFIKHRREPAAA